MTELAAEPEASPEEAPEESAPPEETPTPRSKPWRDNIEAMAMAVIMALVLKCFLVEAYKIPTGSMQPTLMGFEVEGPSGSVGIFDRILVDKLSYRLRDPMRWEVVVFQYPLDRSKTFVKRAVGLPGEELRIAHGDLWSRAHPGEAWQILRRSYGVQAEMWRRLDPLEPEESSWLQVGDRSNPWEFEGRAIRARGGGEARFGESGPVRDRYDHGYDDTIAPLVPKKGGENLVGDLRVEAQVTALPGCEAVELVIHEGELEYAFALPGPAAPDGATPTIELRSPVPRAGDPAPTVVRGEPWRLPAGRPVRVAAQNLDDLLELFIDGEPLLAQEVERAARPAAAALLRVFGEGADLGGLMVLRDIYYTTAGAKTVETKIPEGHYFVLGDNTQDSADSREWTLFRYRVPDGDGGDRILRGSYRRGENPLTRSNMEDGPVIWMTDEWGERWAWPAYDVRQISPVQAPLVPREMIHGRALAVFWPVTPWRGVVRLGWVR